MRMTNFTDTDKSCALRERVKAAESAYSNALRDMYGSKAARARVDPALDGSRLSHALNPLYMDLLAAIEAWRVYWWRQVHQMEGREP